MSSTRQEVSESQVPVKAPQAAITTLRSASGKIVGQRTVFSPLSAKELKSQLKESGYRGKELTTQVNAALRGEKDVRWMLHDAKVSVLRSGGFVPDYTDVRKLCATTKYVLAATAGKTVDQMSDDEVIAEAQRRIAAKEAALKN